MEPPSRWTTAIDLARVWPVDLRAHSPITGGPIGKPLRSGLCFGVLKGTIILVAVAGLILALLVGCKTTRAGYESPKCRVVAKDGKFEVRDYPALVVAETSMAAGGKGMNSGFNKLFRFITGSNAKNEKIAMTTPVLVDNLNSNSSMAFVMPSKCGLTDLPQPADSAVRLRKLDAARYAVMKFSGLRTESSQAEASARLLAWVKTKGYEPLSASQFAYYDPPWVPGFLRRNEVLIRVKTEN